MGDQLAKGWADSKAQDPPNYDAWAARERQRQFQHSMELASMWEQTEAEIEDEEDRHL